MKNIDVYHSSDYAGVDFSGYQFYYGYESEDEEGNWCFQATGNGLDYKIPGYELCPDSADCVEILLTGIAHLFSKGILIMAGKQS